jgi:hypothetical protein
VDIRSNPVPCGTERPGEDDVNKQSASKGEYVHSAV